MSTKTGWLRVSAKKPCAICFRPDWCGFSDDGELAVCMREDGGAIRTAKNGGWIHRLTEKQAPRRERPQAPIKQAKESTLDCAKLNEKFQFDLTYEILMRLVKKIGVSDTSLLQLDVGYSEEHRAYTFPMRAARGEIVGFRVRNLDGSRKFCVTGSKNALFVPRHMTGTGPLLIVEGPTDAAALVTIGFDAIGRPSNTGGADLIVEYCRGIRRDIVLLHDRDDAGSAAERTTEFGARRLAELLQPNDVYVTCPPRAKDARQWVLDGATHDDVSYVIGSKMKFQVAGGMGDAHTRLGTAS